ncbi:Cuticlin-1 [Toxocara canis]|uniref:Cuticlin-1 n=1 Tax=Toxocara canis TaxID=6265 RepID=A0A0B2VP72_TOXCA|nr:Cuticlin-1 [Toxocara canis]
MSRVKTVILCWLVLPAIFANDESLKEVEIPDQEIIELPAGKFPEPECGYNVHLHDRTGPKLSRQVSIGEPLYHRWSCNYGARQTHMYCMMVYNCTVSSTRINSPLVPIIDEFGCSLFPTLIPHVTYVDDLDAGLKSNAFSLDVDEPAVIFHCSLRLLLKLHGVCRRPQCIPIEWYRRRSHSNQKLFFKR